MRSYLKRRNILLVISGLISLVILSFCLYFYVFHNSYKSAKFYYPDSGNNRLSLEKRKIKIDLKNHESFELNLVRDYMLGPMNYNLKFPIKSDIDIINLWLISEKSIVIDFNKEFINYLKVNHDECRLFLEGLFDTLRANTKLKKVYIMSDNKNINTIIGNWNLAYPVVLINDNKKTEKKKSSS